MFKKQVVNRVTIYLYASDEQGEAKARENKMKVKQTSQMFACCVGNIEILMPCIDGKQGRGGRVTA